jgi:protein-disulfide isomerase
MTTRLAITALCATPLALVSCKKEGAPAASPSAASQKSAPGPLAARYGQKQITLVELDETVAQDLYELRKNALEKKVVKDLVEAAARKARKDVQALLREVAEQRAGSATEEDLKKAYEDVKDRLQGTSFEDAKPLLKMQAQRQRQNDAVSAYVEQLKREAGYRLLLAPPRAKVEAKGPAKGPAGAPVTIVEFSDFECPYCSRGRTTIEKVMAGYPGKIRLVFRDFPLDFHEKAQKAAEAGLCAEEQGKFWPMHDRMFDAQDKLDVADLKASAKSLGLDAAKFDACLDSGKMAARVKENREAGAAVGVSGTPAFFINGRLLSGAQPLEKFKEVIDEELAGR